MQIWHVSLENKPELLKNTAKSCKIPRIQRDDCHVIQGSVIAFLFAEPRGGCRRAGACGGPGPCGTPGAPPRSPRRWNAAHAPVLRGGTGPRHHHSFRGSFSAGSTPIFASNYAFFSIFQALQENHLLASRFAKFCNISRNLQIFWEFLENFRKFTKVCKFLQKFAEFFTEFCKIL